MGWGLPQGVGGIGFFGDCRLCVSSAAPSFLFLGTGWPRGWEGSEGPWGISGNSFSALINLSHAREGGAV